MVRPGNVHRFLVEYRLAAIAYVLAETAARLQGHVRLVGVAERDVNGAEEMRYGARTVELDEPSKLFEFVVGVVLRGVAAEIGVARVVVWHVHADRETDHLALWAGRRRRGNRRHVLTLRLLSERARSEKEEDGEEGCNGGGGHGERVSAGEMASA